LGFVRDIVIASFFGTGAPAQAFVVAFRIPNMLRDLVGEGAANAAIVPVLTEYKTTKTSQEFLHLFRVVFNVSFVILAVITLLGVIFSSGIVCLIAPGFIKEPEKLLLTIQLNRIIFPYILLIGLAAVTMGALNSLKHFAAPAFGAGLLNVALIAATLYLAPRIGIFALAAGVLVGGILQLAVNMPVLYKKGLSLSFTDGLKHPANRRIGLLLLPRALGSAVYQINIFVDTILASLAWIVGAGGVAALYYANRLIQFPLGIFSIALAQAALPKMSEEVARGDMARLKETLSFSLRMVFLIILPAGFGLMFLGSPIVKTLFEHGEFDAYSTAITSSALFFYSFGLVAYSGIKILVSCFYSLHDTMTPVKTAAISLAVNVALNLILMWPMKLGGLALATSISAALNFFLLFFALRRRIGGLDGRRLIDTFARGLLASIAAASAAFAMVHLFGIDRIGSASARVALLFGGIGVAIVVFILAAVLFKIKEMEELFVWISKKR
jgi:putative peptidoglycan lipid II flippase